MRSQRGGGDVCAIRGSSAEEMPVASSVRTKLRRERVSDIGVESTVTAVTFPSERGARYFSTKRRSFRAGSSTRRRVRTQMSSVAAETTRSLRKKGLGWKLG